MSTIQRDKASAVVDGILKFLAGGGFLTVSMLTPNASKIFDKPLAKYLSELDKRSRDRELRRLTYYMKQKGLISYTSYDYEHGVRLTKAGRQRLKQQDKVLTIPAPAKWDKRWRLVFFDIPISENHKRQSLTWQLRQLGFLQLQKSIWVHPYPCRPEIEALCESLGVRKYLTYIEVLKIDNDKRLQTRFKTILNT